MPTPTTGTFRILATSLALTGDNNWTYFVASDMEEVFNSITDDTQIARKAAPANYNVAFGANANPDTANIILNPGTPDEETLAFSGLPGGFTVLTLTQKLRLESAVGGPGTRMIKFFRNGSAVGSYLTFSPSVKTTLSYSVTPVPSKIGTFFGTNYGFDHDGSGGAGSSTLDILGCWIDGTYELKNFSYFIRTKKQYVNGEEVNIIESSDDIISVPDGEDPPESSDPDYEYKFYGTDDEYPSGPVYVWWYNPQQYIFYIYSPVSPGRNWVKLPGTPTCTGCLSLTLGVHDILAANASGIYAIVKNKTRDTVYERVNGDTADYKMPKPFGRTGFLP